jgi:hypothetical protein
MRDYRKKYYGGLSLSLGRSIFNGITADHGMNGIRFMEDFLRIIP